jgi:amino acid transporter
MAERPIKNRIKLWTALFVLAALPVGLFVVMVVVSGFWITLAIWGIALSVVALVAWAASTIGRELGRNG